MNNTSGTDWARIDAMTDDDIDTSNIPPLTDEFFAKAQLRMPTKSTDTIDALRQKMRDRDRLLAQEKLVELLPESLDSGTENAHLFGSIICEVIDRFDHAF